MCTQKDDATLTQGVLNLPQGIEQDYIACVIICNADLFLVLTNRVKT